MDVIIALQNAASPTLDAIMMLITNLGSEQVYVALIVLAFVCFSADSGRRLALYFLVGAFLMELIKALFGAPRPFELVPEVLRVPAAVDTAGGPSFPSGHALTAMLFWGLAASYVKRSWFSLLAAVIVALVALSRIYLGVHFPIDVLVGLTLGFLFVLAGRAVDKIRWHLPRGLVVALGLAAPLALHLLLPTENSGLYMGAVAAFLVGPVLVPHRTDGGWPQRVLLGLIGLALVFGALMGSSALIPSAIKYSPIGSFVRYLLVGLVGTVLVPLVGRWLRLVPGARAPVGHAAALAE